MLESEKHQAEVYDRLAAEYDQRYQTALGRYYKRLETDPVLESLPLEVGVLLDLGTGTGRIPVEMQRRVRQILGVDLSHEALRLALAKRLPNSSFLRMNARQLALTDGSVDAVTCLGLLEYISDPRPYFGEVARVLRPGGVFVFTCHNRDGRTRALQERWSRRFRLLTGRSAEPQIKTGGASFSEPDIRRLLAGCSFHEIRSCSTFHTAPVWFGRRPRWIFGFYETFIVKLNRALWRFVPSGGGEWIVAARRS